MDRVKQKIRMNNDDIIKEENRMFVEIDRRKKEREKSVKTNIFILSVSINY